MRSYLLPLLILYLVVLSACASTPTVDQQLVKQYTLPVALGEDETLVYVIRQNAFLGAARGLYVALNDRIVANVRTGQYCFFKVTDDINTINLEQTVPFGYYRIDHRPGEVVYLYFEMTSGNFYELPQEEGITMVMTSSRAEDLDGPINNNGYTSGIFNPGFVNLSLMKATNADLRPDSENATITFIRPQSYAKEMVFGIWGEEQFLGNLAGETYFEIKVPAGTYYFLGKSEHFSILKADVETGKQYFVKVAASMGWTQAHIRLLPVTKEKGQDQIQKWRQRCKRMTLDETAIDAHVQKRLDLPLPHIRKALADLSAGKYESRHLAAGDGM
jgi:hypothetical protein